MIHKDWQSESHWREQLTVPSCRWWEPRGLWRCRSQSAIYMSSPARERGLSLSLSSSLSIYQLYQDTLSHQYHLKYHRWFDLFLSTFRFFHIFGSGKWFWFSIVMQSRPLYAICIYRHDVFSSVIEPQVVYMLNQKFFPVAMEKKYFSWKKSFSWIQLFLLYWKKNIFSECAEFSSLIHLFNVVLIAL